MYKHIIWDFDGTLFDTYPVMGGIFKDTLKEDGIDEPLEEIVKYMKVSMHYAIKHYEQKYHIDNQFIERYEKRRKELEVDLSKPFEGIKEICKYIYTSNKRNYLYTHRGDSSIQLLKIHGLHDYFTDFITKQQGFARKPSPDAINYFIDKYNMNHKEAIMIGDRDVDLLAAKNAGIDACFFTDQDKENHVSDFTIKNIEQLHSIL